MSTQNKPLGFSDRDLKVIPFFAAILFLSVCMFAILFDIKYRVYEVGPMLAITVLLFVLSKTFFDHEANVMKAALSAILIALVLWELYHLTDWLSGILIYGNEITDLYDWFCFITSAVFSVLFVLIAVCHFILTSGHRSHQKFVILNSVALIIAILVFIVSAGYSIYNVLTAETGSKWWGNEFGVICMNLFEIAAVAEVVAIDMRLDMFRQIRDMKRKQAVQEEQ